MSNFNNPENQNSKAEGGSTVQISKGNIHQHLECLKQWLKDERADMQTAADPLTGEYHKGRCCGFVLAIELLEGRILELDGN